MYGDESDDVCECEWSAVAEGQGMRMCMEVVDDKKK